MEKEELKVGVHLCKKHRSKNAVKNHVYGFRACDVIGCWREAEYFEKVVVEREKIPQSRRAAFKEHLLKILCKKREHEEDCEDKLRVGGFTIISMEEK